MRYSSIIMLAFIISASFSVTNATDNKTSSTSYSLKTITDGLNYPWSIAFLPNGNYLISLRSGELRIFDTQSNTLEEPLDNTPKSYVQSQGGYFDVVLDPAYPDNKIIYLAFAYGTPDANGTRIIKAKLDGNALTNISPIFTTEPLKDTAAHYGGRMQFLSDGTLTLTTGDGFEYREAAQDKFSQLGKVIRINADGSVPSDNPFADGEQGNSKVYSYGHRSPQGLAYDRQANILYMHEHGPKGGDEVNIIKAGANYGWPGTSYGINYSGALISPLKTAPGVSDPIKYWTPSIAPSGLSYYDGNAFPSWQGSLFVGALVDQEVRRLTLDDGAVTGEETLFSEITERIRDIKAGPDGLLYILTDSDNGKLIQVKPL